MSTLYIETYGCQMNEYDTGIITSLLEQQGHQRVDDPDKADILLFNTCAVRERAQERIFGRINNFTHIKRRRPGTIIGLVGCVAQSLQDQILVEQPDIDLVVGPDNYRELSGLIEGLQASSDQQRISRTILSRTETYADVQPAVVDGVLAFVTVMRGCNNFCSFCVVPYTRGRERSRHPQSVIEEIQTLIEWHGVREVTLLGQNVNSYRFEQIAFADLIEQILEKTDIQRIRFTSPHPHDFPESLLALMAHEERVCAHIHLPLQSGSTPVLERMRRDYTREDYIKLVEQIRHYDPDMGITTDIIAGFPGETEDDHRQTMDLMETVGFDMAFMFKYSERPHTSAYKKLPDNVDDQTKTRRLQEIIDLQNRLAAEKNRRLHERRFLVLVEKKSRKNEQQWMGRTAQNRVVIFGDDPEKHIEPGGIMEVEIKDSTSATLRGHAVG